LRERGGHRQADGAGADDESVDSHTSTALCGG
jgi:hypothetical protein